MDTNDFITRAEYEARMRELRDDIGRFQTTLDAIKTSLETDKNDKLKFVRDTIATFFAGGGVIAIIELLVKR